MDPREACRLLGVTPPKMADRSRAEQERLLQEWKDGPLKTAWKKLSREKHPDMHGGSEKATKEFADLSAAYTTLKDLLRLTPEEDPIPAADKHRHIRWGPVEVTLTAEDEALLNSLARVFQERVDRQATQHERKLREFVSNGFGDLLDSLMGGEPPRRRAPRKKAKPAPRRTTTIG